MARKIAFLLLFCCALTFTSACVQTGKIDPDLNNAFLIVLGIAQDLVQETMLKALTFREKFVHQTNLKAWLFTIMKNIFINNYRRAVKARTIIDTTDNLYYLNGGVNDSPVSK